MRTFVNRSSFQKDLKRITKRGYDLSLLAAVMNALRDGQSLPPQRRDHPLKGDWKGWRECHIQPDWLLIYSLTDDEVILAATGTHADLFKS